ncbi:MAG: formylglycine-generating enzyme family protein [Bacteroidia bacterium]|nr:formylglycine-generating enzyme family protein [Bacteroidia bacterium]
MSLITPFPRPITLPSGFTFDMIYIEGGKFMMGSDHPDDNIFRPATPVHEVKLSDYYLSKYPVTQGLWKAVMGEENNPSFFQGDLRPVEQVSWDETKKFIEKLNSVTGLSFRLPTEAEWEYAARGGNKSKHTVYSGSNRLEEVGWYDENSHRETKPVGQKLPNELGIYDMSGNVWEWCEDWYSREYYQECADKGVVKNPTGPDTGSTRVYRGGSWGNTPQYCRVADRLSISPEARVNYLGFRLAFAPPV